MRTIQSTPSGCQNPARFFELCNLFPADPGAKPLFIDIETTGLSPDSSYISLIGVLWYQAAEKKWSLLQWLALDQTEEPELIRAFLDFTSDFSSMISYNGERFDLPFLRARAERYEICLSLPLSLDLYQILKPSEVLLHLSRRKQTDLEKLLHISRCQPDGKTCVRLYLTWLSGHSPALEQAILGHNQEDLVSLTRITEFLAFLTFFRGDYRCESASMKENQVFFTLTLPVVLPFACTAGSDSFHLECKEQHALISFLMKDGRLRQYYENYRDYVYLPHEDTAVPKTIGDFLERSIKKPARPETCYTWFFVTPDFLQDPLKQLTFLQHTLVITLKTNCLSIQKMK